eukprot:2439622-Rhodomonas_salina.2
MPLPRAMSRVRCYAIGLRACYAKPGTDVRRMVLLPGFVAELGVVIAYAPIRLRACYAMCGTDLAYGAMLPGT